MNRFKILSIDGGGLRGIIPLRIIEHIENITGKEIHHSFDMIAGTSTGGLLASILNIPKISGDHVVGRKFSVDEIADIYLNKGKQIFPLPSYFSYYNNKFRKLFKPKFNHNQLEKTLYYYLSNSKITDCLVPIFITSFDLQRNKPIFFNTREAFTDISKNALLKDVCRATSAAPTYFSTHRFNYGGEQVFCVDGGVFMNNPTIGALMEVLYHNEIKFYNKNQGLQLNDIYILSVGTGKSNSIINSKQSLGWGELKWIKPALNLLMDGPLSTIHNQVQMMYKQFESEQNYLRLNIDINEEFSEMSNSSDNAAIYWENEVNNQIINNETANIFLKMFLEESGILMP